jgi:hypothetical protein
MSARSFCVWVALAVSILLGHSTCSHAQGTVNFNNLILFDLGCGDVVIRGPDGWPLEGTNYVAQLYYGPSASSLVAHTSSPAPFRPAGVNPRGTWLGGNRILTGLTPGQLAVLSVRAWDIRSGATYEQAAVRIDNGPFYYQVPGPNADPTDYFMHNFRAINYALVLIPTNGPPLFHVQPQSQAVRRGENVMLTVVVSNNWLGHWRFNGNVIDMSTPCRGAQTLLLTNVQPGDAGSYQFIAGNHTASVTSEVAVVSVVEPAIVRFANDVPFQTPGERIVRWPDGSGITGTNYLVQLYYGPNSSTLQPLPDPPLRFRPHNTATPGTWVGANRTLPGIAPGTQVWLEVRMWDSRRGATFEQAQSAGGLAARFFPFTYTPPAGPLPGGASLYMENFRSYLWLSCPFFPAPVVHVQPTNHTVQPGSTVKLSVVAEYPCRGEWYFNGAPLPETSPGSTTLTITNVQATNVGDYYVRVSNITGPGTEVAVTSQVARVTLVGQPRLSSIGHSAGQFMFEVPANPGETFVIETTTNLGPTAAWIPIRTNTAPFWFTNSTATDRQRFYRTVFR